MAFSEYVLLVSLSAGIHAHGDAGGTSIGAEAITQPNGGARGVHVALWGKQHAVTSPGGGSAGKATVTTPVSPSSIRPHVTVPTLRR
jgi:hypothetical protein